ncbi:hypothetical protein HELRODRAFT_174450 [Helobdella robusta]|uniref:Fibrinogen C-terminal domain-containing protein n=1 Tax=Helobdella robusta TaxID=6412 RepID=T1F850_HELRO|nr:hypothetical protein HELRODRAFT_174450 [Helobdella robusta]ESO01499.1 hypothetical protein HELRODRAFT_174450 [Helobdella robusta]
MGILSIFKTNSTSRVVAFVMSHNITVLTVSKSCNFPFTFNGGLFYSCSNSLPGIKNPCALYMCLTGNRQLSICLDPQAYSAVNKSVLLNIPTFATLTPVTSVNEWIVIQQRIDGFGIYDKNFWFGLEKMHQLTTSADYRLRFEVLIQGAWYSDEYDHFKVNSELKKYSLNVSGYIGDRSNVLNCPTPTMVHNGMKFTTFDMDNDLAPKINCAVCNKISVEAATIYISKSSTSNQPRIINFTGFTGFSGINAP